MIKRNLQILVAFSIVFSISSCYQVKTDFLKGQIASSDNPADSNEELNRKVIRDFYTAFKNHDAEGMVKFYSNDVEFEDPAFGLLKGERAKNMWRMLVEKGKDDLKIDFHRIRTDQNTGSVDWDALYNFSLTGSKVHNKVHAQFVFKDGLIYRHKDNFDLWTWSKSAFGITGLFLGNTGFFKNKLNEQANKGLDEFIAAKSMSSDKR